MENGAIIRKWLTVIIAAIAVVAGGLAQSAYAADCTESLSGTTSSALSVRSGTCGSCDWTIDSNGKLTIEPSDGSSGVLDSITLQSMAAMYGTWLSTAPWSDYAASITSAYVAPGVKAGESCALLSGLSNLESADVGNLDTSEAVNLSDMFCACSKLTSVELKTLNTSKVTRMSELFQWCSALKSVDLSGVDTGSVTFMAAMFYGCSGLEQIVLGPKAKLLDEVGLDEGTWKLQGSDVEFGTDGFIAASGTDAGTGTWVFTPAAPVVVPDNGDDGDGDDGGDIIDDDDGDYVDGNNDGGDSNGSAHGGTGASGTTGSVPANAGELKVGETSTVASSVYVITSNGAAPTASLSKGPKAKSSATVPASVTINGKKYSVTGIAKGAFKKSKAKTVTIKTAKLTKKSVKGCFKGSKVKVVKVKAGSKKLNKKLVKKYKKFFTKANCGAKVKVK